MVYVNRFVVLQRGQRWVIFDTFAQKYGYWSLGFDVRIAKHFVDNVNDAQTFTIKTAAVERAILLEEQALKEND